MAYRLLPAEMPMLATVLAAGPVGLLFVAGGYIYDPPTLALFTVCLALMAAERWRLYAVVFVLMCFCRETAIILPAVYLLWRGWRHWPGLLFQLAAFAAVRAVVTVAYAGNPGELFETHWLEHVQFLCKFPLPNILALTIYGAAVAVALRKWASQPPFMKAAGLVVPAIFAAYWLVGFPGEIRVCLEAYPVLMLLAWHGVAGPLKRVMTKRRGAAPGGRLALDGGAEGS